MATSTRFFRPRIFRYFQLQTNFLNRGQNYCSNTRNEFISLRSFISDRISNRNQGYKWKSLQPKLQYSIINICDYHTSPSKNNVVNEVQKENLNTEEEQAGEDDCLYSKVLIEIKGHDPEVINSYEKFVSMTAENLNVKIRNIFTPPKVITRYTLLKSIHIFKKHRVQYENRTHFRTIELAHLTGSTTETILEYIQRNLPEGIAMKVTKHRLEKLPQNIKNAIIHPQ